MFGIDVERGLSRPLAAKHQRREQRATRCDAAAHDRKLERIGEHITLADGCRKRLALKPGLAVFLLLPRPVGHRAIALRGDRQIIFITKTQPRSEEHTSELPSLMRNSYA